MKEFVQNVEFNGKCIEIRTNWHIETGFRKFEQNSRFTFLFQILNIFLCISQNPLVDESLDYVSMDIGVIAIKIFIETELDYNPREFHVHATQGELFYELMITFTTLSCWYFLVLICSWTTYSDQFTASHVTLTIATIQELEISSTSPCTESDNVLIWSVWLTAGSYHEAPRNFWCYAKFQPCGDDYNPPWTPIQL